jgi:hypothetical protein
MGNRALLSNVRLSILGILAGIATGALLVLALFRGPTGIYDDLSRAFFGTYRRWTTGQTPIPEFWDLIAISIWKIALVYSVSIAVAAIPIWLALGRFGMNKIWHAILLGATLGGLAGASLNNREPLGLATIIAPIGAISGLVTWTVAHKKRKS